MPYKVAFVPPSVSTKGYNASSFAESLISQLVETEQLKDDLFVDDRTKLSVARRISSSADLGILSHICLIAVFV